MNDVKVYASPLPFSNAQIAAHQLPGSSLQEIVDNLVPDHIKHAGIGAVVQINGEVIPMQHWANIRPKQGTLVNVRVVPQGGGGKKNPITALLSIAVLIAAPYIAGAVLGAGLAATQIGIGTLTYGGLLSSAIGVVGRLAISALAPPPKASNAGFSNVSNPTESPTQFIEGARNSLNPYGVVPINLGTNRVFPLQAASPYTETENNDQYVRQLFTYGYSNKTILSELKIGDTALDQFKEFDIEHKLQGDLHEGTNLYTNDVFQEDLSIVLTQADGYSTRTTAQNADEAIIDITFPQGLASFNDQGKRNSRRVKLEAQYAKTGESPQDWSPAAAVYKDFSGRSFTVSPVSLSSYSGTLSSATRRDVMVVNIYSGTISIVTGQGGFTSQPIPSNTIRLANIDVTTTRETSGLTTTEFTITDIRSSSLFGGTFEDSNSFVPSKTSSTQFAASAGAILVNDLDISANTAEALRRSVRVVFPERGQYDIRIRRTTGDTNSDQILDQSAWSAIKSVTYESPVNLENLAGTAIRIKATDQLNGALDQFNAICESEILDYDPDLDDWVERITSNPASLYRWVLQGPANEKPLADSRINIDDLQEWHQHCVEQDYSYNRMIDYETSVDEILRDIAASGAASPAIVDGKRTIVIDKIKDDIVQIVTPRNSWGYTGEMIYPEIPHAFRVQFRNEAAGYLQDELIVYDDGYDESNATLFEVLELQSCTNADLAFKTARRHLASIRLRPETHTFMMDVENLVALRGDRIKLEHDVPLVGVGDARIKAVETSGDSPNTVEAITLDDTITIPKSGSTYYVRIRLGDGTQIYKEVVANTLGEYTRFAFVTPFDVADTPAAGDLLYCVEAGGELDLIITRIEPQDDLTARVTAINYAPEIFDAENAPIPAFNSKLSIPLEFIRPIAPVLLNEQSNEDVMLLNSDGSFLSRAVFTLENRNEGIIETKVKVRASGTTPFTNANILEATPERLIITGLEDGTRYDIHIRYRRAGTNTFSRPLELNSYLFIGTSGLPDDVEGFLINVVDDISFFKWDANDDIDLSHYIIKYSNVYTGATWETAQTLEPKIFENKYTAPFLGGTYLIKAVDLTDNESETATAIITYNPGDVANAIALVEENPDFEGTTDNVLAENQSIVIADPEIKTGYYYFANNVDLTGIFPAFVSARVIANGTFINNIMTDEDIFAITDLFGQGENNIFDIDDLFANDDVFGIGTDGWAVDLEYRTTQSDPNSSPVTWADWAPLEAGTIEFWAIEFRIKLTSIQENVSPQVTELAVTVDMPDRIERGDDINVPIAGATVQFSPQFKEVPAVAITIQDGDVDDKIEFTSKTAGEFSFKVYNETAGGYVARSFDYIASGYGRKST